MHLLKLFIYSKGFNLYVALDAFLLDFLLYFLLHHLVFRAYKLFIKMFSLHPNNKISTIAAD